MGVARIELLRHRQERRREQAVFDTETVEAIAQAYERVTPQLDEERAAVAACVGKLRGRLRQVFEMRYVQGRRPAAIAAELGRTPQSVFAALHRGRLAVRDCVGRAVAAGANRRTTA
jgi:RNA polymerase sigma-70 factor (ECF subfamily)